METQELTIEKDTVLPWLLWLWWLLDQVPVGDTQEEEDIHPVWLSPWLVGGPSGRWQTQSAR